MVARITLSNHKATLFWFVHFIITMSVVNAPETAQEDLLFSLEDAQTGAELLEVIDAFVEGNS